MMYCPPQQNIDEDKAPQIIRNLLDQNKILKTLSPQMIMQVMIPFKIPVNSMMDQNQFINKIKDKLTDIILEEKQQCVEYLTLPKFKNLTQLTKKSLKQILGQVWGKYQEISKEEEQEKKCALFFCTSKNQKEVEAFHLGLFNFFKTSFFYGCMGNMNNQEFYQHQQNFGGSMLPQNGQNYMPHFLNNIQDNSAMNPTVLPQTKKLVKVEQLQNDNFGGFLHQDQKYGNSSNSHKINKKQKKVEEREPATPFHRNPETIQNKGFSKCKCKGKYSKQRRYFDCMECNKMFHFTCLRIPSDAVKKPACQIRCPECLLRKNNVFYQVIGQPVQSMWIDQKQFSKLKITIESKISQQILKNHYSIQLRFLKFTGKSMFNWQSNIDSKPASTKKGIGFNEILIKNDMLNKGGDDEIKISLESGISQMSQKSDNSKNGALNYAVAFVVRSRTVQQIMKDQFEATEDGFLDSFFKDGEDRIKIEITDGQLKMIETPVRGINCQHVSIFDLQQMITHSIQLGSDTCFYCPKKCQNFKIDHKIQQQLKKIKQTIDDPDRYPSEIYYHKDGTFSWQQLNLSQGNKNDDDEQDNSGNIDMEIEDEDFNNLEYSDENK